MRYWEFLHHRCTKLGWILFRACLHSGTLLWYGYSYLYMFWIIFFFSQLGKNGGVEDTIRTDHVFKLTCQVRCKKCHRAIKKSSAQTLDSKFVPSSKDIKTERTPGRVGSNASASGLFTVMNFSWRHVRTRRSLFLLNISNSRHNSVDTCDLWKWVIILWL